MKKLIVFTGAGMSAESGLKTFRDHDGLWENYNVAEVATPTAWSKNPKLVLEFYNKRRQQVLQAQPNEGHFKVAELEKYFDVEVITQNIDDLHERAGSSKVLHLHGEITKARSQVDPDEIHEIENGEIQWGDKCSRGLQLRPFVVWFGEAVPAMVQAEMITSKADVLLIIGTSLNVYPAAGLAHLPGANTHKFLIDPGEPEYGHIQNLTVIKSGASEGMNIVFEKLLELQ